MARKAWRDLSPSYRRRLERRDITQFRHDVARADLSEARGHGRAPEHPYAPAAHERAVQRRQSQLERAGEAIRLMRREGITQRAAAQRVDIHESTLRDIFKRFGITTGRDRLRALEESEAAHVPFIVNGQYVAIWVEPAHRVWGVATGVASQIGRYFLDVKMALELEGKGNLRAWRGRFVLDLEGNVLPFETNIYVLDRAYVAFGGDPWEEFYRGAA
jgi:hypothetical protein